MSEIKEAIRPFVPRRIQKVYRSIRLRFVLQNWIKAGRPVPPPHYVKQLVIREYQRKFPCDTLVETGTYLGDMIDAQMRNFKTIYSIELSEELWANAVRKFKDHRNITILQGDSGTVLKTVVPKLNKPSIFWLDGHYSGGITAKGDKECPIFDELSAIFESPLDHILLIDDARCFNGKDDYPTIEELSRYILSRRPKSDITVKDDIIRVVLKH